MKDQSERQIELGKMLTMVYRKISMERLKPNKPVTRLGFVLGLNWPPLFVSTGGMDKGGKWWGPGMAVQDRRSPEEVLATEKRLRPETFVDKVKGFIKTKLTGAK